MMKQIEEGRLRAVHAVGLRAPAMLNLGGVLLDHVRELHQADQTFAGTTRLSSAFH